MQTKVNRFVVEEGFCRFHVERQRSATHIFSVSLWKGNLKYVPNLTAGLLWWPKFLKAMRPSWNIRFYIDPCIFDIVNPFQRQSGWIEKAKAIVPFLEQHLQPTDVPSYLLTSDLEKIADTLGKLTNRSLDPEVIVAKYPFLAYLQSYAEWENVVAKFEQKYQYQTFEHDSWHEVFDHMVQNYANVEVWKYECAWGAQTKAAVTQNHSGMVMPRDRSSCHIATFGSLMRFHPFADATLELVAVRNLELLSSEDDLRRLDLFLQTPAYTHSKSFTFATLDMHATRIMAEKISGSSPWTMICAAPADSVEPSS